MPDQNARPQGTLFGGVFDRGEVGHRGHGLAAGPARRGGRRWPGPWSEPGSRPPAPGQAVTAAAVAADFSAAEVAEVARATELTGNPVPGLARVLARRVPRAAAPAVHQGATSQDIMDTAAMLLARRAIDVTRRDLLAAAEAAARLADDHRDTLMIGRTLLQQAVPVTFGLVAAGWLAGLDGALTGWTTCGPTAARRAVRRRGRARSRSARPAAAAAVRAGR